MKYLHDDILAELTARLTDCPISPLSDSRILQGRVEAFTMKRTASDKRYVLNNLNTGTGNTTTTTTKEETKKKRSVSSTPTRGRSKSVTEEPTPASPPRGLLRRSFSIDETAENKNDYFHRRLLTDLILTLNLSFSDYDFGAAVSSDFGRHQLQTVVGRINRRLGLLGPIFLSELWSGIDAVITLSQVSVVYSFLDTEAIPNALLGGGQALWSFNYFFVNRNTKRIVLFTCLETLGDKRRGSIGGMQANYSFIGTAGRPSMGMTTLGAASVEEENESAGDFDLDPAEAISVPLSPVHSG